MRREARRRAILRCARTSIMKHGYAGTTMSGIAAALGGSKTTLWSYFPTKEALFGAVLDEEIGRFREEMLGIFDLSGSLEETLRRFCTALLSKILQPDTIRLHRVIIGEAERFPEIGRIFFERAPKQTQERLAAYLAEAMERGELRKADPLLAARQLTMLIQPNFMLRLWKVNAGRIDPAAEAATAVDTFLRAYAASTRG
jgi:TetR/AcrR family transcriptional repressor of mexJK operon